MTKEPEDSGYESAGNEVVIIALRSQIRAVHVWSHLINHFLDLRISNRNYTETKKSLRIFQDESQEAHTNDDHPMNNKATFGAGVGPVSVFLLMKGKMTLLTSLAKSVGVWCKCRVRQKLRNSRVLYNKTKNPLEAKFVWKLVFNCSNTPWK